VLQKRKAVCEGFSNLFHFFCTYSGFESYPIGGYISKNGNLQNRATHSWDLVKIDEKMDSLQHQKLLQAQEKMKLAIYLLENTANPSSKIMLFMMTWRKLKNY
jgi:hypothetical protein